MGSNDEARGTTDGDHAEATPITEIDPPLALERPRAHHQERLDRGARLRDEHAARHQRPAIRVNQAGAAAVLQALAASSVPSR